MSARVECPHCGQNTSSRCTDTRVKQYCGYTVHWRRRDCAVCGQRFTSLELSEDALLELLHRPSRSTVERSHMSTAISQAVNNALSEIEAARGLMDGTERRDAVKQLAAAGKKVSG